MLFCKSSTSTPWLSTPNLLADWHLNPNWLFTFGDYKNINWLLNLGDFRDYIADTGLIFYWLLWLETRGLYLVSTLVFGWGIGLLPEVGFIFGAFAGWFYLGTVKKILLNLKLFVWYIQLSFVPVFIFMVFQNFSWMDLGES